MELRHLRYFTVLAEELHFSRAADRLFIAQPGLSRQIKQLEEEIGVALFDRNNRRVALTEAGRYLRTEAERLLREFEVATVRTRQIGEGLAGQLRIGYIGSAMQRTIPELMLRMEEEAPGVRFSLRELDNPQQLDALLAGEIDLGFVRLEEVAAPLETKAVFEDTFSLVLPADHPVTAASFTGLEQFRDEPFILFEPEYSRSYYDKVLELFSAEGFAPVTSHSTVNASSIYRLVASGMGLSIVPTALAEGYDMGVRFIELVEAEQRTVLRAVWRGDTPGELMDRVIGLLPQGRD